MQPLVIIVKSLSVRCRSDNFSSVASATLRGRLRAIRSRGGQKSSGIYGQKLQPNARVRLSDTSTSAGFRASVSRNAQRILTCSRTVLSSITAKDEKGPEYFTCEAGSCLVVPMISSQRYCKDSSSLHRATIASRDCDVSRWAAGRTNNGPVLLKREARSTLPPCSPCAWR